MVAGRTLCLQGFEENERGFRACANEALRRGKTNPLGLLMRMVRDRDFDVPAPEPLPEPIATLEASIGRRLNDVDVPAPEPPPPPPPARGRGVCVACDREAEDALYRSGQWWCPKHEGSA
jgi:hypothetical protein